MSWRDLIQDETGATSSARTSFWVVLLVSLGLIIADAVSDAVRVPEPGYTLLGAIVGIVGVWAAGPRIAQYLGPQIGAMVQGIGNAKRSPREPDLYRDDERG